MMAVVPTSLMQRYENYPLVDELYSIKHFKLSWDPSGCPKFEGYTFLYDDYAIDVSEPTRFTLLEENNFPFYPLVHTIETLVRIPRRRLLIERKKRNNQEYWRTHGGQNKKQKVVSYDVVQHRKEKRKEVNQRYHAKKKDKQQIENEPLQNIDNQPRQRRIRNANNASTSRGIGPIDKENISPHNARDYEVGNNEEAFLTGEHHFTHDEENTEICSAITYETQNDVRDDTEVHLNPINEDDTEVHHFTHDEENTEICSAITYETQNDVRDDTEVHLNPINEDDPYDFVYDRIPVVHRVLAGRTKCNHCKAIKFKSEFATFCCMNGKTKLASTHIPPELYHLFTSQDEIGHMFRDNIRAYNTNFSFTSMGVTLDNDLTNMKSGVYTFRAHGGIYHRIDQLVPRDGKPRYLQLYFYDSETEFTHRLKWPNLDETIIRYLTTSLTSNPYVKTFRSLRDLGPLDNYRVTLNASVELDQRVYNRPTTAEVAGIWVEGNENITTYKRSIVVYGRSNYSTQIQPYEGCYDPLSYPLFFPNGESGWHSRIARNSVSINEIVVDEENMEGDIEGSTSKKKRNTVSMREYYCYKFQMRSNPNMILLGGRLLQQFVVDMYIKIETSRLLYYRLNQKKIRSELYQGIVDCVNAGEVEPSKVGQRVVLPASFIGGPRDMRRRFLDAMTLVQDDGKPDIFLTITCNPSWPEITDYLEPGQDAQDRPDLVSRVFRAKLEDLKDQLLIHHILGKVRAYVYVVEFQKRGLPHAHFLLIMRAEDKLKNPEQYDQKVCAEIPDPTKYPKMHEIVVKHMMHGPCGSLGPSSPCMQGEQKKCRWRYPRQFNEVTMQGNDSYLLYRRRDNGVVKKVRDKILDNRWVVPYNPKLLMMFNCHLNVEVCSSIKSVKYAFKYVYKGHDKQVVHIDPDEPQSKIDEIKRYQDARYVSPPEAIWRIFSFALSQIYPSVMALHLHLPNQQLVRFSDHDIITDIVDRERDKSSMLTAFFKMNKVDGVARKFLYKEFPTYFTWDPSKRCWNQRKKGAMRGRLVSANPAEGERYYLRVLLSHVRGPTCFDDLYTVNNLLYPTFRKAAVERGLVETDDNLSQCLTEASLFQFPAALRRLFATILIYCEPGDVRKLWDEHYNSLSEDYSRQCQSYERVKTMVLVDIGVFLQSMGKHLGEFDLPLLDTTINLESGGYREVQEEYSIVVEDEHVRAKDSLNSDQKVAYDEIMRHVDYNLSGVFFIDGPGGTGKTFLYKALLAEVRSRGLIALATASSGAAANNMPGGRTAHSRFKIPINLDNNSMCNIKQQSGVAQLLRLAKIIIWDESSMAHRQAVEAVDRSIQDITKLNLPFGGKIMILGGDFRQVLPVVRRGTRAQIVDSSLRMSPLWPSIKKLSLTINMRALADPWFSEFLMRVGDGEEGAIDGTFIRIPDDMSIPYTDKGKSKDDLIDAIFPSLQINGGSSDYIISRAILSTKNENVDEINDQLIDRFIGEQRVYYSFDEAEDDINNFYPMEFLNSLNVSGLPPHYLRLKIGCPIILLRNIDPSNGLCNGTRLICKGFQMNVIDAEIAVGHHAGKRVFLPRIPLCPSADDMFPFKLKRKQFPIRLSFAMTINKAQGQTIPNVGVYLPESVFSHGQLYVALSRGISRENTKVLVKSVKEFTNEGVYTSNVVYREVLHDI
ncbi:hypothetical protein LXL04_016316 [Taraxacum kok-saghyz]